MSRRADRGTVQIRGIGFVGTHTQERTAMSAFALTPVTVDGIAADVFALPNGDVFAVASPYEEDGAAERTIGFLVDDLDPAIDELHAAGVETDGISVNDRYRCTHFRAPDGQLYELVEERAEAGLAAHGERTKAVRKP